jgi:ankyrin repeat protein
VKNCDGRTPLHFACKEGYLEVVKLLIELGADKEAKDKWNETPLHLACIEGHLDVVKLLIYR